MGVGEHLKEIRLKKSISLEEIEEKTRIRKKYLRDIEAEEYHKVPGEAYARGFIKSYAECLDLEPKEVLRIYRREQRNKQAKKADSNTDENKKGSRNQEIIFVLKKLLPWIVLILVLFLLIFIFRQVYVSVFSEQAATVSILRSFNFGKEYFQEVEVPSGKGEIIFVTYGLSIFI